MLPLFVTLLINMLLYSSGNSEFHYKLDNNIWLFAIDISFQYCFIDSLFSNPDSHVRERSQMPSSPKNPNTEGSILRHCCFLFFFTTHHVSLHQRQRKRISPLKQIE
uniref:Uncharacterized protein n=1 Tax=Opuntia streptacantha TaxID=393608 RepID=A0A7C8ZMP9_OPUST